MSSDYVKAESNPLIGVSFPTGPASSFYPEASRITTCFQCTKCNNILKLESFPQLFLIHKTAAILHFTLFIKSKMWVFGHLLYYSSFYL